MKNNEKIFDFLKDKKRIKQNQLKRIKGGTVAGTIGGTAGRSIGGTIGGTIGGIIVNVEDYQK